VADPCGSMNLPFGKAFDHRQNCGVEPVLTMLTLKIIWLFNIEVDTFGYDPCMGNHIVFVGRSTDATAELVQIRVV